MGERFPLLGTTGWNDLGTKTKKELERDLDLLRERAELSGCLVVEDEKQRLIVTG